LIQFLIRNSRQGSRHLPNLTQVVPYPDKQYPPDLKAT
jgi:hypothetical protein